ncbi:MAG: hypothetical protein PF569_04030, partial [Candidatus Woesearchaeota archaeon]|jgi:hypothetical protein|nr:hypothetical protein [Candidatus Woesearchaeota archaeon]
MSLNPIKFFKHNLNSPNSTKFIFFGNSILNLILTIYVIGIHTYIAYKEQVFYPLILGVLLVPIVMMAVIYMSRETAKATIEYEKKVAENIDSGGKEKVMDTLNWKSILIIFLLAPLIIVGIVGLVLLVIYLFS